MRLQVTNVHGQIGITTHNSVMQIRQPKAQIEMKTVPAELNAHTELVQVKIDQRQCFSEAGLKPPAELSQEFAQRGKQAALDATAKKVYDGNRMATIKNKVDVVAAIATENALPPPDDFNITLMPTSRPKINFEGGVSFSPRWGRVDIKVVINRPEINVTPGWVEVYLLQKPNFSFEFVGDNVDLAV